MSETVIDTEVLICGGGPVGMALAIELGGRGINCVLCERRIGSSLDPKAKFVNLATMAIARRWGIADLVRRSAPLPPDFPSNVVYSTGVNGYEIARIANAFFTDPEGSALFPEPALRTTQPSFERSLLEHLLTLPSVTVLRGAELASFAEVDGGIRAEVRFPATNQRKTYLANFLAGCDGARSKVRESLAIEMNGEWGVAQSVGAVFHAPQLETMIRFGRAVHHWIIRDDIPVVAGMGPLDTRGQWFLQLMDLPAGLNVDAIDMASFIRSCLGPDVPFDLQSINPWSIHHLSARKYRVGRAFILGDAAHLHSPTGGFGLNTGIGDAVDLGWKLAAVLRGWGYDALLDTFETERRPIHDYVMKLSIDNLGTQKFADSITQQRLDEDVQLRKDFAAFIVETKTRHYRSIAAQLGTGYFGSPLVSADEDRKGQPEDPTRYVPSASPGSRAPHVWLEPGVAIADRFGQGFTLLHFGPEEMDLSSIVQAGAEARFPLLVTRIRAPEAYAIYGTRLVLVRPDHFVAWRGDAVPPDCSLLMAQVRGAAAAVSS